MKKQLLPMHLQFFAEPEAVVDQETSAEEPKDQQTEETSEKKESGKTFTRDDVAKMIAAETDKALAKARQDWEKEKSYEQMTAQERLEAKEKEASEKEALAEQKAQEAQARIERLERAEAVRKDLSESGLSDYISATAADLLLVKDNDEDTKKATDEMKQIIASARKGTQKELLRGESVKVTSVTSAEENWRANLEKRLKK